jgi:PKD repeat protein
MDRNPTHAYAAPDAYEVRLTVTDNGELSDESEARTATATEDSGGEGEG